MTVSRESVEGVVAAERDARAAQQAVTLQKRMVELIEKRSKRLCEAAALSAKCDEAEVGLLLAQAQREAAAAVQKKEEQYV